MDTIIVLDFGGQYCHLISRRVRELGVYCSVMPGDTKLDELKKFSGLKGVILSGGAASVYDKTAPKCDARIFKLGIPILGICYGLHLIAALNGGEVRSGKAGEFGLTHMEIKSRSQILCGLKTPLRVWMNHRDIASKVPPGYNVIASTQSSPVAAFECPQEGIFGVQFHPEVTHTEGGRSILENFVFGICNAKKEWDAVSMIGEIKDEISQVLGSRKAIIGLSGGVDSSTAAMLISEVIGKKLVAVYVDTGLMRHGETEFMKKAFPGLNLKIIDAHERFFDALRGVTEPEMKRKAIGKAFIEVFDEVAVKENAEILIQGTIYSDRIESGITKNSSNIKSHHNVGGLPEHMRLQIYEPLRLLYKDEVREISKAIRLPEEITQRHVFPGPGLGIRIVGEVTEERALIVRRANQIVEEELKSAKLYDKVWMGFAVLLPIKSVGIQGDSRSYKYPVVVRIIESKDAMTANFSRIPYDVLERISTRITNEVAEVNRVVYDISNKPPATMEWE